MLPSCRSRERMRRLLAARPVVPLASRGVMDLPARGAGEGRGWGIGSARLLKYIGSSGWLWIAVISPQQGFFSFLHASMRGETLFLRVETVSTFSLSFIIN
jgi:hypothetical protein